MNYIFHGAGFAFLGAIIGSFIALMTLRLPRNLPVFMTRSRCDNCGRKLYPWELIPIFSFACLRGKCATCRAPIAPRHLVIELIAAGIGGWAAAIGGSHTESVGFAVFGFIGLAIAILDNETLEIPDSFTLALGITGLAWSFFQSISLGIAAIIGAAAGFSILGAIRWAYGHLRQREGLGAADPLLLAAIGAWVGWQALPIVLLIAAIAGLALVCARAIVSGAWRSEEPIPFGPCLILGGWIALLYGKMFGLGAH